MSACAVRVSEIKHDLVQVRLATSFRYTATEQRAEAITLANQYLASAISINDGWGREFPLRELMVTIWDHELYEIAFVAQANGNPTPMTDLILRCARHACAVHLFGEERAENLGFAK